jgi:hypothetical protein
VEGERNRYKEHKYSRTHNHIPLFKQLMNLTTNQITFLRDVPSDIKVDMRVG